MSKKDKIEDKINDLNAIRARYHRDLEAFERKYKEEEISKEELEKHKNNYEKKREKIREKIHSLKEKLEKMRKTPK